MLISADLGGRLSSFGGLYGWRSVLYTSLERVTGWMGLVINTPQGCCGFWAAFF